MHIELFCNDRLSHRCGYSAIESAGAMPVASEAYSVIEEATGSRLGGGRGGAAIGVQIPRLGGVSVHGGEGGGAGASIAGRRCCSIHLGIFKIAGDASWRGSGRARRDGRERGGVALEEALACLGQSRLRSFPWRRRKESGRVLQIV